jgi:hypothetical protein
MPESNRKAGLRVSWGMEHRDGEGNLISRQVSVAPPQLTCVKPSCIIAYLWNSWVYSLVMLYHKRRLKYAESHRRSKILERYRTGDPSPDSFLRVIYDHIKLACPFCRRIDI